MCLEYGGLGELRVRADGVELALGGARQRALLARLLIDRGRFVSRETLVDDLYGNSINGAKALHVAVARVRRALAPAAPHPGASVLVARPGGYRLSVAGATVDADRFQAELVEGEQALAAGDAERACRLLTAALAHWRGPAWAEVAQKPWARGAARRLEELRLRARELLAEAEIALHRPEEAIAELKQLATILPESERVWERLMLALYRAGRQADALSAYREARRHLVHVHGIEPGPRLRDLQHAILLQDASLDERPPPPVRPAAQPGPLIGRTAEHAVLAQALEEARGGTRVSALIGGETGIGKTHLAAQVAGRAAERGFLTLHARCDRHLELPLQPLAEAVEQLPRASSEQFVERDGDQGAVLSAALIEASRRRPLFVLLEDIHWADRSTLLALRHLLTSSAAQRIMIVATYRAGEIPAGHVLREMLAELRREPGVLRLELTGLSEGEVAELAGMVLGELRPGAVRGLHSMTGGNPFYLIETLRAVGEAGVRPYDWDPDAFMPLSPSVRETVAGQVSRLGEDAHRFLCAASVLGPRFNFEQAARIAGRRPEQAVDLLEAGLEAGLLRESEDEVAFHAPLIARVLSESISQARRRDFHRRAASLDTRDGSLKAKATGLTA